MPGHNNFVRLPQNPVAVPIVVTTLLLYLIYLYPIVLIVLLPLYKYLFTVPIDVTNKDDDDSDKNKGTKRYNKKDYPPPYPNGWYCILHSYQLAKSQVANIKIFGQDLAVFRGADGIVHVIDAICPHLGANMAVGGKVVTVGVGANTGVSTSELECPFHGWRFDGRGACTSIPYCSPDTRKDFIKNKSYLVKEVNQQILIWFTCEAGVDIEPYEIPVIAALNNGNELQCYGITSQYANCHIQEIPENGADVWHLSAVHEPFILSWLPFKHCWSAKWYVIGEQPHMAKMELQHRITCFGKRLSFLDINVDVNQIGSSMVYLVWTSKFGSGILCQNLIPVRPLQQKIVHTVWCSNYVVGLFAKFFLYGEDIQVRRDIVIWNNKKFLLRPTLIKEDRLIKEFRTWYSQFYSVSSYDYLESGNNYDW